MTTQHTSVVRSDPSWAAKTLLQISFPKVTRASDVWARGRLLPIAAQQGPPCRPQRLPCSAAAHLL